MGRSPPRGPEHGTRRERLDRIDAYLGYPTTDPHGDPIPKADGTMAAAADKRLTECEAGERFHVARVTDQSPEFLRFLSQVGLAIGTKGSLVSNDPADDSVTVSVAGDQHKLSIDTAGKLMVR